MTSVAAYGNDDRYALLQLMSGFLVPSRRSIRPFFPFSPTASYRLCEGRNETARNSEGIPHGTPQELPTVRKRVQWH